MLHVDKSYKYSYYINSNNIFRKGEIIIMKKRLVIIGIMVCCLLTFAACKSEGDSDVVAEVTNSENEVISEEVVEAESVLEEVEEAYISDFEPQVIYDQDGIVVTATEYYIYNHKWETQDGETRQKDFPILAFEVANNSDEKLNSIHLEDLFIDGIDSTDYFMFDFLPTKETAEDVFNDYSIESIETGETKMFYLRLWFNEYFVQDINDNIDVAFAFSLWGDEKIHYSEMLTFNTKCPVDSFESTQMIQYDDNNILFENDSVKVYLLEAEVKIYEESNSGNIRYLLMCESKIFEPTGDLENLDCIVFGTSIYTLSPQYFGDMILENAGDKLKSAIMANSIVTDKYIYDGVYEEIEDWSSVVGAGYYQVEYEHITVPYEEDEYESLNYSVVESGYINIPIDKMIFEE